MAQQYGLGRGLSSLIPPKKPDESVGMSAGVSRTTMGGSTVSPVPTPSLSVKPRTEASPFVVTPRNPAGETEDGVVVDSPVAVRAGVNQDIVSDSKKDVSPSLDPSGRPVLATPTKSVDPIIALDRNSIVYAPLHKIIPNPEQPRAQFDQEKLSELAQSIREHGILQPLVVTRKGDGYELIAGERRLQAAKLAGLVEVPVIIRSADERTKLELAIIENTQRHNLNPIEEAKAYLRLIEEYGLHQEEVAKKMGKSRSLVANTVRLLHLPVEIQRALIEEKISEGHAKALLGIENPEKQRALFEMILKSGLTVRETEIEARSVSVRPHARSQVSISPEFSERLERLREKLGTQVKLSPTGQGGKIVIEYYSDEELQGLFRCFGL